MKEAIAQVVHFPTVERGDVEEENVLVGVIVEGYDGGKFLAPDGSSGDEDGKCGCAQGQEYGEGDCGGGRKRGAGVGDSCHRHYGKAMGDMTGGAEREGTDREGAGLGKVGFWPTISV